jgi:6-phosphogluconate dehydrogenase (decarboxylating)
VLVGRKNQPLNNFREAMMLRCNVGMTKYRLNKVVDSRIVCVISGVNAARDALLTFMVGGSEASYQAASEYLSLMGKNVVHCGAVGTGQVIRYFNVMIISLLHPN